MFEEVPLAEDTDASFVEVASTPISTDISVSSQSESSNKKVVAKRPIVYSVDSVI